MLVSSPKYLGTLLTVSTFILLLLFLSRNHAAEHSLRERVMAYAYEPIDQTVIGGGMTELYETPVYDKLSGDTPSDIEANWSATIAAKSLLQKVREFRDSTQPAYNDDPKRSVRRTLEDAEHELEEFGKASFDTTKIVQGVRKLKVALDAAEEVFARDSKAISSTPSSAKGDTAAAQRDVALQEAEADRMSKEKAASLERLQKAELDAVVAESEESRDSH